MAQGFQPLIRMNKTPQVAANAVTMGEVGPSIDEQAEILEPIQQAHVVQQPVLSEPPKLAGSAQMLKSFDEARAAGEMVAEAEVGYADAQARAIAERTEMRKQEMAQRQELQRQKELELTQSRAEELAAEKEAGQGYWETRSVGAKIASAIAAGLGAYAATMTGTQNFAAQTIENAVRQDAELKIRKARLAQDRTTKAAAKYDSLLNQLKDESAVQDVILADNFAMARAELDKLGSRAKSREVQARYHAARGELDMKIQDLYAQAAQKAAAAQELMIDETGTMARTKEEAKEIRNLAGSVNAAEAAINDIIDTIERGGEGKMNLAQRGIIQNKVMSAIPLVQQGLNMGGQMSERNAKLLEKLVADPTSIFDLPQDDLANLQSMRGTLRQTLNARAQAVAAPGQTPRLNSSQVVNVNKLDPKTGQSKTIAIPRDKVGQAEQMGWKVVPIDGVKTR